MGSSLVVFWFLVLALGVGRSEISEGSPARLTCWWRVGRLRERGLDWTIEEAREGGEVLDQ